ncbi:MAG: protoheme IX farnesyltransferase [Flavobacteriales bacterium]|nr:MAG: protoheme IX farnesyltransferase [Flavobacteriales bacterium]
MSFTTHTTKAIPFTLSRLKDYAALAKLRLSTLVVFSAAMGYFIAASQFDWVQFLALVSGGFLVTGASNAINQILERDYDKLMQRTANRPLPAGRMNVAEALFVAVLMGVGGVTILFWLLNPLSGWLGLWALVIYVALYTPLKRITPFAVLVGAIPGAIPPMLGYVAVTGEFGLIPGLLFLVQFFWQFPHFWAIAWKLDDDYKKAGFKLLPTKAGKSKSGAFIILVYSIFLIPVGWLPVMFHISGYIGGVIALLMGIMMVMKAIKLYNSCDEKAATRLMFASFVYLPIVLIGYVIDKL